MRFKTVFYIIFALALLLITPIFLLFYFQYFSKANAIKANLVIDSKKIISPMIPNWKAIAQGGEEPGVRMFQNVIPQMTELNPRYIRLDHLYDFYNVVGRDGNNLTFNWTNLDATVCDILATGAKPFFALGYMPSVMSEDGSPIGKPKNWNEWSLLVQKTIEHYSGINSKICNKPTGLTDIYYEVWNEPDLESFGSFKYWGDKNYLTLYQFASLGASTAQNTYPFKFGGPATTALYKNWVLSVINFVSKNNLRLDFISWHHYTTNPDDYTKDLDNLNSWLLQVNPKFRNLSKIITEWGYDASYSPLADSDGGAAYTIASLRNLVNKQLEMAFSFEVKDGPTPRWGILSYTGEKKPRFFALRFLNLLKDLQLQVEGEGTYVRAISSFSPSINKISTVLVNYDPQDKNNELVPITFNNLIDGPYQLTLNYTNGATVNFKDLTAVSGQLQRSILMKPNMVIGPELQKL